MIIKTKTAINLLKKAGAKRVGKKAGRSLAKELEQIGIDLSKKAVNNAKIMGRTTIKEEDIAISNETRGAEEFEV